MTRVCFGNWNYKLYYLDLVYNSLASRIIQFAREAGEDPYDRHFDAEPLVDFAVNAGLTDRSVDCIYRHYVYHILGRHETIDVDREELEYYYREFLETVGLFSKN